METALVTLGILGGVAAIGGVLRWYWQMYRDFFGPNGKAPGPVKATKKLANATTMSGLRPGRGEAPSEHGSDGTDTHASTPPTPAIRKDKDGRRGDNSEAWQMGWDPGRVDDAECSNTDNLEIGTAVKGTIVSAKDPAPPGHVRTFSNASTVKMSSRSSRNDPNSDGFSSDPQDTHLANVLDRVRDNHCLALPSNDQDDDDDGYDAHVLERWKKRAARRFNSMAGLADRPRHDSPMAGDDRGTYLPTLDEGGVPTSPVQDASADPPYHARPDVDSDPQRRSLRGIDRWVGRLVDDVGGVLIGGCQFESKADRRLGIGPPVPAGHPDEIFHNVSDPSHIVVATRLFPEGSDEEAAGGDEDVEAWEEFEHPRRDGGGRLGIGPFRRL